MLPRIPRLRNATEFENELRMALDKALKPILDCLSGPRRGRKFKGSGPAIRRLPKKTIFSEGEVGSGPFCSLSFTPNGDLLVHDMLIAYWLGVKGKVREAVPLARILDASAEMVRGTDRLAVCPTDPTVLVFSHPTLGTPRFEKIMHEPNTALSLHDRWLGTGKNMRITPRGITAFDPVWSRDGKRLYFVGYKDTRASDADLFRIYRMERFGTGLLQPFRVAF